MSDYSNTIQLSIHHTISVALAQSIEHAQSHGYGACVVIRGVAGCGKSHFAYASILEAPPYIDQDRYYVPRCLVPVPSEITLIQLLRSILIALGEPIIPIWYGEPLSNDSGSAQSEVDGLVHRVIDVIQLVDVEYIIFDDFHYLHMIGGERDVKYVMETLFEIINRSGKCFVLMGLPEKMDKLMSTSLRLRLISSVVDFEPFSIDWNKKHLFEKQISEFNKFVADAANRIGIQLTSRTKHEKLLERIHLATNGVIGKIFNLFVFAEGRAKQLGQETVDLSILAWAYDVRLSESQNLDETSNKKRNPFKRKFDTRTYPVSINDVEATNQPTKSAEITTRFAHRVEPYVDETVISWLLRITFVNRYVDLDFMLRFFKYTFELTYLSNQQLNRDTDKRIIELFSDLARVPTEKLRSQSLQNYWSHLVVPERSVKAQSEGVLNLFRALVNDHPRICPICLHESTYIRQKWHLDPYCICEAHGTAMIDTCLNCGEVYEIEDIFRDCCSACGSRFSAETILLADISEQLPTQTRIINWIENGEHQLPDLPEKSFDTIMTVIYGLVDSVIKRQPPGKHCTPTTKAELYELAMEVIEDPSTYFYAYLNEYRNNQSQTEQYGFEAEFGTLYSKWLIGYWNSSEFDFIHEAFNEYLYTEFVPYDGITNAKWLHLYPDFWDKSDFISVQSAVKQNRALKLSKLLLAIHAQQLQLHVAPDSYSQYVRKSDLRRFILNLD